MAGGSNGYRPALVRRQLTPGLISSLPGTAGLPPFISFSTSYPELPPMPKCMTRRLLSQRASAGSKPGSSGAREPAAAKKPWWRFWYRGTPNHPLQQTPAASGGSWVQAPQAAGAAERGRSAAQHTGRR